MTILSIATLFFFVTNPIGNAPAILALTKEFGFERQKRILIREVFIAFCIAVFFQFFGELFFVNLLNVRDYTTNLTGGILLFLAAFEMIFPKMHTETQSSEKKEPFIVPIATPLLSGPGLLTIIMLKSSQEDSNLVIFSALLLAWVGVACILMVAPYLQKILKKNGMIALEQLMGMVLTMMAVEMMIKGIWIFKQAY